MCDLNMIPNSHDYPTNKSVVLVKRMTISILGMKGLLMVMVMDSYTAHTTDSLMAIYNTSSRIGRSEIGSDRIGDRRIGDRTSACTDASGSRCQSIFGLKVVFFTFNVSCLFFFRFLLVTAYTHSCISCGWTMPPLENCSNGKQTFNLQHSYKLVFTWSSTRHHLWRHWIT